MKKVFLDELPRKLYGGKICIDWYNSVGFSVKFEYNDLVGYIKILRYIGSRQLLYIEYNNIQNYIYTNSFRKGQIAEAINIISINFKFNIGDILKDNNRDLTLTDHEYRIEKRLNSIENRKWYKYTCNICRWTEGWVTENSLLFGCGCSCCSSKTVVEGINDIPTTTPWMVKYFQGGYDEAKHYVKSSHQIIYPICPDCGDIKEKPIKINDLYFHHSIGCNCGDGISYPNKFIYAFLSQIVSKFEIEKKFDWSNKRKYDVFIADMSIIIENHGLNHYQTGFERCGGKSLEEEVSNDKYKEQLAKRNKISHYIVLDCRYSELDWIKNSILNSELLYLLHLEENDIDWIKCHEYALSNIVKTVCKYRIDNMNCNIKEVAKVFNLNYSTITRYLKRGSLVWDWINIDELYEENKERLAISRRKNIEVLKNDISLGIFNGIKYLARNSEKILGIKLYPSNITNVCMGRQKSHKGFIFKYV
ncbi:MAG: hypothetical protein K0S41_4323 [Anaerocolumna sp.]|jgi:hypothetical protein|nr:hypothetical protein [Anaerocolumna sp.]